MNIKKILTTILLVILAFLSAFGGYLTASFYHRPFSEGNAGEEISKIQKKKNFAGNILLLGKDVAGGGLTDVMMVIMIDEQKNQVNVISIPRDTKVKIKGKTRKINSAYVIGKEEAAIKAVKEVLGIPINYYCVINIQAFKDIIDALDGVSFYLKRDYDYDDPLQNLHIHLKKGQQVLDGEKAEQLIRYRHDYARGDYQRIEVQQEFLQELIKQKLNSKYISKIPKIYSILNKNIVTNMTGEDILNCANVALKIKDENIKTMILPGESKYTNGAWYFIHDPIKIDELLNDIENNTQSPIPTDTKAN